MDPAHAPFLAAILADVDSDAPRLRYADFLDETGDPAHEARAEFIRVQCAMEGMPTDDPRYVELARRESDLMRAYWRDWFAPIAAALGVRLRRRLFSLRMKPRENFALIDPPLGRDRLVTSLSNGIWPFLRVNGQPLLDFDERLYLSHTIGTRAFCCWAWFKRGFVEDLSLNLIGPQSVSAFGRVVDLTPLKSFSPLGTGEYLPALLANENFGRIRKLVLDDPDVHFLRELVSSEQSNSLQHLDLSVCRERREMTNDIDPVPLLAGATCLLGLRKLAFSLTVYPPWEVSYDLAPLLGSPILRRCEELSCFNFQVADHFLTELADPRVTPRLRRVRFRIYEPVAEQTLAVLRERFGPNCAIDFV